MPSDLASDAEVAPATDEMVAEWKAAEMRRYPWRRDNARLILIARIEKDARELEYWRLQDKADRAMREALAPNPHARGQEQAND